MRRRAVGRLRIILAASANQQTAAPGNKSTEPESERDSVAPVVITGSRIPRTNLTAVSPVTGIGGEEFRLQGATNAEELLNQLPQVNPSQGELVSAGATGAATIDLRGLGSSCRTLVLVNGHFRPITDISFSPIRGSSLIDFRMTVE